MKVEFYGKLNMDAVAKKLLEIADSQIVKNENGEFEWVKYESKKRENN